MRERSAENNGVEDGVGGSVADFGAANEMKVAWYPPPACHHHNLISGAATEVKSAQV